MPGMVSVEVMRAGNPVLVELHQLLSQKTLFLAFVFI
jgi:hypothetical protein